MANSTRLGFPYPEDNDPLSGGAQAIQDLAVAIDTAIKTLNDAMTTLSQKDTAFTTDITGLRRRLFNNDWMSVRYGSSVVNHFVYGQYIVPFGMTFSGPPVVLCTNGDQSASRGYAAVFSPATVTTTQFQASVYDFGGDPTMMAKDQARINWIAIGIAA